MVIIKGLGDQLRDPCRGARGHMPVGVPRFDAADDAVYGRFGGLGIFCYLFRRGKVKDRRPGIGHPDSIVRIDFAAAYGFAGHVSGCAGRCAIGGDKIQVIRLKRGLFQKLLDNAWQTPIIGGQDHADGLILEGITVFPDAVYNGKHFLVGSLRKAGCNILAFPVAEKNKIICYLPEL